jgi:PAS domain S-box-containing protein
MPEKILVVDDEPSVVQLCLRVLTQRGYDARGLTSGRETIAFLESEPVDLLVVDIKMPDVDGLAVLRHARELYPDLAAVIITGFATLSSAVEALHAGAHRFVLKPFGVEEFAQAVQETLEQWHRDQERRRLRAQLPILEIAQALLSEGDVALLARQILEPVARELAVEQAALLVLDPETDTLSVVGSAGSPTPLVGERVPVSSVFIEQLRQSAAPIVIEPRDWMQQFLPALAASDLGMVVCVPLRTVRRFVGALCLGRRGPAASFMPGELSLLAIIGGQIASVLENAHLYAVVAQGKREWEETFDAIKDSISIHDADFRIVRANVELAGLLGKTARDLIGRHCYDLVHGATEVPSACPVLEVRATGQPKIVELELPRLGGIFLCAVYPRFDRTGQFHGVVHVLRDITEHKEAEEAVRRRNEELTALNAIATTIGQTLDLDHILNATLDKVLELTGMDGGWIQLLDEKTGSLRPVAHRNIPAEMIDALTDFRLGEGLTGAVAQSGQPLAAGDNEPVLLQEEARQAGVHLSTAIPIRSRDHGLGVLVIFCRGTRRLAPHQVQILTAIGHQLGVAVENARLAQATAEVEVLREIDRLRSQLTANVSHELRTPLGLIKIMSSTLLRPDVDLDDAGRREFLEDIVDEVGRLERIVDNLLDLSRQEEGQLCLECCDTDLGRLLQETVADMALQSPVHHLACELPAEPLYARVDPARVGQVLRNLIDNAIKYSPGGRTIMVRGQPVGGDVLIAVADEGIGIASEDWERVFERFYRVPTEVTMRERGAGLGLSVCKGIVEAHGGRIWVESTPGQGSTFSFTLPMTQQGTCDGQK